MARYWTDRATGRLLREAQAGARLADGRFDLTADVADLPGPAAACRWDGSQVVVDAAWLGEVKARLIERIDELALARVALQVSTPAGTFRIRRDDIERYVGIGFAALFARLANQALSITVRDINAAPVTLDRDQILRLLAEIGARYYAVFQQAEARKALVLAASAAALKTFDPAEGIG